MEISQLRNPGVRKSKKHPSRIEPTLYLNLIWHYHQPSYVDAEKDQLLAPWVQTHGTKDYYGMAAIIAQYPDIHCTINLTPVLLYQLQEYYVKRLGPFVDRKMDSVELNGFLQRFGGKTDPWLDLALLCF